MDFILSEFSNNSRLYVFTDGSVNNQSKVGYGAYLLLTDLTVSLDSLNDSVKFKRFEHTSSTKLELQTLLWLLGKILSLVDENDIALTVFTDSQNIIGLPRRRERLEKSNYYSSKNKRLNNYELYREFYRITDKLNIEFVKVSGHQAASKKDNIDILFSLVDKASRRELRKKE